MERQRRFSAFVSSGHDPRPTILQALEFARAFLTESCLEERGRVKAVILVEEIISNLLRHGGADRDVVLCIAFADCEDRIAIEVEDDGNPFDPLTDAAPQRIDPVTGGGAGIAILRAWGEDIQYSSKPHGNRLTLTVR